MTVSVGSPSAPSGLSSKTPAGGHWTRRNFAPVLLLTINGQPASDLLAVCTSFNHKESTNKAAETKFTFRNDSRRLMDDPRLLPNTVWYFRFGYLNDMSPLLIAQVRNIEPDYKEKRTVAVTLYDASLVLTGKSMGRNWGTVPSSTIAKKIASEAGLKAIVDESYDKPIKAFIQPRQVNDLQFLRDLAAEIDYEVYVEGTPPALHFVRKKYDAAPRRRLTYVDDPSEYSFVKSFSPKVKGLGPIAAGVASADANNGGKTKSTSTDGKDPALASQKSAFVVTKDFGTGAAAVVIKPAIDKSPAKPAPTNTNTSQLAATAKSQMLDKANEASSSHPLTPSLRKGSVYEWAGLEKQIDGKWYLNEVTYTISGSGHATTCEWKRNAQGKGTSDAANKNTKSTADFSNKLPNVVVNTDFATGATSVLPAGSASLSTQMPMTSLFTKK
jgi:phage protein D